MNARLMIRAAAWILFAAIAVVTLTPIELRPVTTAPVDVERFAAFLGLGLLLGIGYPKHRVLVVTGALVAAAGLEGLQLLVPGRHGHLADAAVKAAAALIGTGLAGTLPLPAWGARVPAVGRSDRSETERG
jgi:VanZ family protein